MSNHVLQKLSDYVVSLTDLKFTGRLIVSLDFYQGGIRCASRTVEENLSIATDSCTEPNPD